MRMQDIAKEKRINAIHYFCKNTKYLTETKLYKLLYFLDFLHFKEVGRPVTDLEYFAWDFGPVPTKLFFEIKEKKAPKEILMCIVEEKDEETGKKLRTSFKSLQPPNIKVFSDRELQLLEKVAFIFKEVKAKDISEISHLKNEPWQKTLESRGEKSKIDFLLSLDKDAKIDRELAIERLELSNEIKQLFVSEE